MSKKETQRYIALVKELGRYMDKFTVNPAIQPAEDLRQVALLLAIEDTKDRTTGKPSVHMFVLGHERVTWVCLEMWKP